VIVTLPWWRFRTRETRNRLFYTFYSYFVFSRRATRKRHARLVAESCHVPAVRLGDRFVCPLPDTRNYCTFGREDKLRIVPRFGIPAALAPKPCN